MLTEVNCGNIHTLLPIGVLGKGEAPARQGLTLVVSLAGFYYAVVVYGRTVLEVMNGEADGLRLARHVVLGQ